MHLIELQCLQIPGGMPDGGKPCAKPGGGPPLPGNPCGKPGPPTPAAGPCNPAAPLPRPAGRLIPGPACIAVGAAAAPEFWLNLAAGSEGGGPSTEHDTTVAPLMMARPSMRFSSVSTTCPAPLAPGALLDLDLRFTLRNSSQSARTRFMCCEKVSCGVYSS